MRILASFLLTTVLAFAQNLTEFGAAAAGSVVGGASGKPVSNGITAVFGKAESRVASASVKTMEKEPAGVPQADASKVAPASGGGDPSGVPIPPPPSRRRNVPAPMPVAQFVVPEEVARITAMADVAPVLPPPPVMSREDFGSVAIGMTRPDVLTFGAPSSKITMFEDGHLVEVYSYYRNGQKFGGLRLTDGVVSSIQ